MELGPASRPAISRMWEDAQRIHALPAPAMAERLGSLREADASDAHMGQLRKVGVMDLAGNARLDTRLRRRTAAVCGGVGRLELLPRGLEELCPGFTEVMIEAQQVWESTK